MIKKYLSFFLVLISLLIFSFSSFAIVHEPSVVAKKVALSDITEFDALRNELWQKYLQKANNLSALKSQYEKRQLTFADKTMLFSLEKRGSVPKDGFPLYIALHGGGETAHSINDSQWQAMKTYYLTSVKEGIYIAPRGISDHWNLHFEEESYPLYDKLIEAAILFENVNPNRVYIVGFSAGGDGVYQVATKMADRFAAANMSAGHNNHLTFDNLINTPFLLQVGELDHAFDRNHVTVKNAIQLDELSKQYGVAFKHDVFVHYNGSHNSWRDNDYTRKQQIVMKDPIAWLSKNNRQTKTANTNAIDWLSQFNKVPQPQKIVWDLSVSAKLRSYQTGKDLLDDKSIVLAEPKALNKWLDVSPSSIFPENGKLIVELDKNTNSINVIEANNIEKFRILINPHMLELNLPIAVKVRGNSIGYVVAKPSFSVMARTLFERSDVNQVYCSQITLALNVRTAQWEIIDEEV